ncbi:hypothetical protein M378DRAFT_18178 [Amanita muscaria Koide BX008]|uniref:Uncharacterized protein n=1 Tax=Amanita muscaria (strain Koide BX008) TaxID=946122 RepID=A0A0C2W256_AMAMK|nr:hypothetical protein M378DRAFT_18178 [Amanita muscaria Koide BX008]
MSAPRVNVTTTQRQINESEKKKAQKQRQEGALALKKHRELEEKRAQREKKKEKAYHPDLKEPEAIQEAKHFLGRAQVCVVLPHLGGSGPALEHSPLQRDLVPAQVQRLVDLAGCDAENLQRFHPEHELVIGISGKLIDKSSLTKSQKGPFKDVKFSEGANESMCNLLAGQHRISAMKQILGETLKEYHRVTRKLKEDTTNLDLAFEQRQLVSSLRINGKWLVSFYDLGMFYFYSNTLKEDEDHRHSILLKLSTNNEHKGQPDTPEHHFKRVVCSLSMAEGSDYQATWTYAKSLTANNEMDVRTLLVKYPDCISLFEWLFKIPTFTAHGFQPKLLVEAHKTIWGMVEPFFLLSKKRLFYLGRNGGPATPASIGVISHIVKVSQDLYVKHLKDKVGYFGQESSVWKEAFEAYWKEMGEKLCKWAKTYMAQEDEKEAVKNLETKLGLVLDKGEMPVDDKRTVPLLCPDFMQDLLDLFTKIQPALLLIASWITPGLEDQQKQRARKVEDNGRVFFSATCSMFETFKYFSGFQDQTFDWVGLDPEKVMMLTYGHPPQKCRVILNSLWFQIIQVVLSKRNTVLIPLLDQIKRSIQPLTKEATKQFLEEEKPRIQQFMVYLEQWSHDNYQEQKKKKSAFRKTDMEPRQMQVPPSDILSQVKTLGQVYAVAFSGFSASSFNWMVTPKNNNTETMRKRFATSIILEALLHVQQRVPLLENNPDLFTLREELKILIKSCPLLNNFNFWCPYNKPRDIQYNNKEYEDTLVEQNQRLVMSLQLENQFNQAFQSFANKLAKPGILGIPILGEELSVVDHGIHPALEKQFQEFYKLAKDIHRDCKTISLEDLSHKMQFDEDVDPVEWEDCPIKLNFASSKDKQAYYCLKAGDGEDEDEDENEDDEGKGEEGEEGEGEGEEGEEGEGEGEGEGEKELVPASDDIEEPRSSGKKKRVRDDEDIEDCGAGDDDDGKVYKKSKVMCDDMLPSNQLAAY